MSTRHLNHGKRYEVIKEFRDTHIDLYFNNLAKLVGCSSIEDVFNNGYSILELEEFSDEASIMTWGDLLPNRNWRFECRKLCNNKLTELYGSPKNYFKTEQFSKHHSKRIGDGFEKKHGDGIRNPSQLPEHRLAMSKGSNCKNPFASEEFKYNSYIRGKTVLPSDKNRYEEYALKVNKLTEENRPFVPFDGTCYYTGLPIYKYDGNKKVNRNDWNMATLDHKISLVSGFLRGYPAEKIASIDNLCWCSKYFNTFKGAKTEDEVRMSGMIERFKEVWCLVNEGKERKDS